jgi:tetratricopeptide (TPR) repeat protein
LSFADGDLPTARTVLKTDAIPAFERLLAGGEPVLEDRLRLALCYRLLGDAESGRARADSGSPQAARDAFLQARVILEQLVAQNPAVDKYQMHCAAVHNSIALLELGQGRTPEALAAFRQADLLLTRLVREHPRTAEYSRELAMTLGLLANARLEAGEMQPAQAALDRSIQVLAALGSQDPRDQAALENAQRLRQSIREAGAARPK